MALAFLAVGLLSWLVLYIDSCLQLRKAERLIADLKTFPFATAKFVDARDLAIRNGGRPNQSPLPSITPKCTPQDCYFYVDISTLTMKLLLRWPGNERLARIFVHIGLRPWSAGTIIHVKGGKMESTSTGVGQLKIGKLYDYEGLLGFGYSVQTGDSPSYPLDPPDYYYVGKSHVTGPPGDGIDAHISQTPGAPMQRAFDINIGCFTKVLRACSSLQEIAPAAWADYQNK